MCNENSLPPLIGYLGLRLYRTSHDNTVPYDHDLESYALFDKDGNQAPKETVDKAGETFERILEEAVKVRDEQEHDMPLLQAISIVFERHSHLKLEGLHDQVLQWCVYRLEAWFAADADGISLKTWDQERVLTAGYGLMVPHAKIYKCEHNVHFLFNFSVDQAITFKASPCKLWDSSWKLSTEVPSTVSVNLSIKRTKELFFCQADHPLFL